MTAAAGSRRDNPDPAATAAADMVAAEIDPWSTDLDWLAGLAPEEDLPPPSRPEDAEKMLRLRRRFLADIDRINAAFEPEIEMLENRRRDLVAGPTRQVANLTDCLDAYARKRRVETGGKVTHIDLPHGRLQTRAGRASTEITAGAEDRIVALAREHGVDIVEHVPETWKVSKAKIAALVKAGTARFDERLDCDPETGEVKNRTPVLVVTRGDGVVQIDGLAQVVGEPTVTIEDP